MLMASLQHLTRCPAREESYVSSFETAPTQHILLPPDAAEATASLPRRRFWKPWRVQHTGFPHICATEDV